MDWWRDELEKATSQDQILQGATDFLQCWAPRELDPMNLGLIEMRIETAEDIDRVRRSLEKRHTLPQTTVTQEAHLQELASYLGHAASKVEELRFRFRAG